MQLIKLNTTNPLTMQSIIDTCRIYHLAYSLEHDVVLDNNANPHNEMSFNFKLKDYQALHNHLWRNVTTSSDMLLVLFDNLCDLYQILEENKNDK